MGGYLYGYTWSMTVEEAALLVADLARLKTKQLTSIRPEIIALRDRIRELAGSPVGEENRVSAALDKARATETARMTKALIRDWEAQARVSATVRLNGLECLECGKKTEVLSLHVQKAHRMTWDKNLTRWDLHDLDKRFDIGDYPRSSASFIARQRANTLERMEEHPDD